MFELFVFSSSIDMYQIGMVILGIILYGGMADA